MAATGTTAESKEWRKKLAEVLVIGAMPLLYGAATRLPFIYFVIHLTTNFNVEWARIGLFVGCYQGARVVTSAVSISAPKSSHFLGTTAGLAGYVIVYVSDKTSLTPFVVGTAMVGFSETMSSMQKYGKEMYKFDANRKKAQLRIKFQYAFVMIGVVIAFGVGGVVYEHGGINGVAFVGIVLESSALLVLFAFWSLTRRVVYNKDVNEEKVSFPIKTRNSAIEEDVENHSNPKEAEDSGGRNDAKNDMIDSLVIDQGNNNGTKGAEENTEEFLLPSKSHEGHPKVSFDQDDGHKVSFDQDEEHRVDFLPNTSPSPKKNDGKQVKRRSSIFARFRFSSLLDAANTNYTACDLPATWINWLLCATFGVEALTIGFTLGIGPIFLLNEFDQNTGVIGALFAIGGAFGTIAAIGITCTKTGNNLMMKIAASPFDLCFAMGGIAAGVLVATIPSLVPHAIGLILLMAFNDIGATLMTELQASITTTSNFAILGPFGQVVRRCLNVVTAVTGPVLFGVYPRLPYLVAGITTLIWTIMLFVLFKLRMEKTYEEVSGMTGRNMRSIKYRMSFCTSEVVHSMAKSHKTTADMKVIKSVAF